MLCLVPAVLSHVLSQAQEDNPFRSCLFQTLIITKGWKMASKLSIINPGGQWRSGLGLSRNNSERVRPTLRVGESWSSSEPSHRPTFLSSLLKYNPFLFIAFLCLNKKSILFGEGVSGVFLRVQVLRLGLLVWLSDTQWGCWQKCLSGREVWSRMQSTCQTGSKVISADRRPRSSTSSQLLVSLNGCVTESRREELSFAEDKGNVTAQSTLLLTGSRSQAGASRLPDRGTGLGTLGV